MQEKLLSTDEPRLLLRTSFRYSSQAERLQPAMTEGLQPTCLNKTVNLNLPPVPYFTGPSRIVLYFRVD